MTTKLTALSEQLAAAVERAGQHVVTLEGARGGASGILFTPGVVVTADHALQGTEVKKALLPDGAVVSVTLAGRDPGSDLAILKIDGVDSGPIPAHPAAALKPGHLVLGVGRSAQHGLTASFGVISFTGGPWRTWRGGHLERLLRLDLALHPSASGGAVVDAQGNLIGMGTRALSRAGAVAIPAESIARIVDAVLTRGRVTRGYLGVGLQPVPVPHHLSESWGLQSHALMVVSLEPNAPAENAGLLLGDILVRIEGRVVADTDDVMARLDAASIGHPLHIDVLRGGQPAALTVTVGERE
jgi:S1-C subfamily serine protease